MKILLAVLMMISFNLYAGEADDERTSSRDRDPKWDCPDCDPIIIHAPFKRFNVSLYYGKAPYELKKIVRRKLDDGSCVYEFHKRYADLLGITASYRIDETWNVSGLLLSDDTKMVGFGFNF